MARSLALRTLSLAVLLSTAAFAQPVTSAWTYQGQLNDGAAVADGPYDFIFRLFTLSGGGVQVGSNVTVNDKVVTDGLFTVQLDFGAVFDGNARWLDIQVRPGASGGAYTLLTPRQALTATPYALYALNSPSSGGGPWSVLGTNIYNTNTGNVGIGTTTPEYRLDVNGRVQVRQSTSSSAGIYFHQTTPNTETGFVGMRNDTQIGLYGTQGAGWGMVMDAVNGNVGVGTLAPSAKLEVTDSAGVTFRASNTGTGYCAQFAVNGTTDTANGIYAVTYGGGYAGSFEAHNTNATAALNAYKNGGPALRCISTQSTPGTAATDCVVAMVGGTDSEPAGGGFLVLGSVVGANISIDNNEIMARSDGAAATLFLNADGGTVDISGADVTRVKVLEITGADLAEKFPVSDAVKPEPGMVVMIDAANAGKLCLASGAYNKRVAGVISGANNLPAGTILGNLPGNEDAPPVALSGRVWVHCDATTQPIEIGDLLTTSDTPGHAMTASDSARSHGAVIGKAMTALAKGEKGMVLVLVNLQ